MIQCFVNLVELFVITQFFPLSDTVSSITDSVSLYLVQLWTVGNYHWYLKQSLHFGSEPSKAPVCVCWDPVKALHLHLLTHDWTSYTYDWGWSTDRSQGYDSLDNANVAVIDGGENLVNISLVGLRCYAQRWGQRSLHLNTFVG